ncbi:MAG TPA: DUF3037 domain-containing protein [Abditibacteriaceae bacterium]|jgi:hypothetical protein
MPEHSSFDYAIVRVVPRVERGEFFNAGVVVFCPTQGFLQAKIELDIARLCALAPTADCDEIRRYLETIPTVCAGGKAAGPIGALPQRSRWHWLVAPRSTIIQMSPVHTGLGEDLNAALDKLFDCMVRVP